MKLPRLVRVMPAVSGTGLNAWSEAAFAASPNPPGNRGLAFLVDPHHDQFPGSGETPRLRGEYDLVRHPDERALLRPGDDPPSQFTGLRPLAANAARIHRLNPFFQSLLRQAEATSNSLSKTLAFEAENA